ncbi:MAG: PPOX class F420-dependent enzyme [Dehalococcoidia bacterium]|nr:PPOX class F420-dependent enzyme [Dehalococcoidia bacterium]
MALDPARLTEEVLRFLGERHVATLTTLRPNGRPHVVPVGFAFDPATRVARVITDRASRKALNLVGGGRAVLCQVDGGRWLSLEGEGRVADAPAAVAAYGARYGAPGANPTRVAIEIVVDRVLGRG